MSQNREDIDHATIILELEKTKETHSVAVAKEMIKCRK
jgi:transcriptional regulator